MIHAMPNLLFISQPRSLTVGTSRRTWSMMDIPEIMANTTRGNAGNDDTFTRMVCKLTFFEVTYIDFVWFCRLGAFAKFFFWGVTKSLLNDLLPLETSLALPKVSWWRRPWVPGIHDTSYSKSELSMVVQPIFKRNLPFSYEFFLNRNPGEDSIWAQGGSNATSMDEKPPMNLWTTFQW